MIGNPDTGPSESSRRLIRSLKADLGSAICGALDDPAVVEIMANADGRIFVERVGQRISREGIISPRAIESVIGKVAHALNREVTPLCPMVSGELPLAGHRFEGILPPAVPSPVFSIRKRASMAVQLDSYLTDDIMSARQIEVIRQAIVNRLNIVVSGGTGSGKTTLTNAILAELIDVAPHHRLVILEDTAEIQCRAENHVFLHTTDAVDMGRLLKSTMRLRPDRIIVGEVRDGAALTLLKAWNTGHPGGVTTIHSNSAFTALTRFEQLVAEVSIQPMPEIIGEAVDLIVSIERAPNGRLVREVLKVNGFCEGVYQTVSVDRHKSEGIDGKLDAA